MSFLSWIEDQIDKLLPKVEASGRSRRQFTKEEFVSLMDRDAP